MLNKEKTKKIKLVILSILLLTFTPTIFAVYYTNITSMATIKMQTNHDMSKTYVRAHIITYWVDDKTCEDMNDLTTCAMSGKKSWNLDETKINQNWTKLNNYYYYASQTELSSLEELPEEIKLIDPNLDISQLTSEDTTDEDYVPQYQVVYEFLEAGTTENNKTTSEEYWCVTFNNQTPELMENC